MSSLIGLDGRPLHIVSSVEEPSLDPQQRREAKKQRAESTRQQRKDEAYFAAPMSRREFENVFQKVIAPMGQHVQKLSFQLMGVQTVLVAKGIMTHEEFTAILTQQAQAFMEAHADGQSQAAAQAETALADAPTTPEDAA